jgi:1-deoxy-D-xylulose 5-phosphate reductoisomerase
MSAANEVAVWKFLRHEIGYNEIYDAAALAVEKIPASDDPDLDTILLADEAARSFVRENFSR